ncbi:MAG: FHA domain-containing protein [Deltaproteobacteria bacterium]|nr:FHA domain-containing protein [Deltaproteobacteria bacterium]
MAVGAADKLRFSLRLLSGQNRGSEYVFDDPMDVVVGRANVADLVLVEGMVSRRHARFALDSGKLFVNDLGSTNGTFVNGQKIRGKRSLDEGDRVLIGTSILKVIRSQSPRGTKPPQPDANQFSEEQTSSRHRAAGDLQEVSVAELLEAFSTNKRDAVLELTSPAGNGLITVAGSKVEDCVIDRLPEAPAKKALLRALGFSKGTFLVRPYQEPAARRLNEPVLELLVEGLFKLDELEVLRQKLPSKGQKLVLAKPLVSRLSALDEVDLDALQLAYNIGEVDEVLDQSQETDLETAQRLLALLEGGYLRSR